MTVGQLINVLQAHPRRREVWLSADSEGNCYQVCRDISRMKVNAEKDVYNSNEEEVGPCEKIVMLWP